VFDPLKRSFNPLDDLTYRKAREIADILYTVSPQGENTLTVRNGKRALLKMLCCWKAGIDWTSSVETTERMTPARSASNDRRRVDLSGVAEGVL
jgi:hypothetical protein